MMKRVLIGVSFVSIVLMVGGCKTPEPTDVNPLDGVETYTVGSGDLSASQYWIGTVQPKQQVRLTPEVGGRIKRFAVDVGDSVGQGDLLLKIDSDESATAGSAASSMASALSSVKASTARVYDEQINAMTHQLEQAKQQVEIAKRAAEGENTGKSDTIRVLEQQKRTAEIALRNLENVYATKEQTIISNTEDAMNQANIISREVLDFVDHLLGISDMYKYDNDSFEANLGARDISTMFEVKRKWKSLMTQKDSLVREFDNVSTLFRQADLVAGTNKDQIIHLLDKGIAYMQSMGDYLRMISHILDNTVTDVNLTDAQLRSYSQQVLGFEQQVESVILSVQGDNMLGLKGAKQMIDGLHTQYELDISNAREGIVSIEKQIEATQNGLSTKVDVADKGVIAAQKAYQALQDQIAAVKQEKNAKLAEIQANIAQTRGQANQAWVMAGNASIKAPFDGVVMERYLDEGAVVGPGVPLLSLGDTSEKVIKIKIPEQYRDSLHIDDIVQVEIGDSLYDAVVDQIAPTADAMTKTVLIKFVLKDAEDVSLGSSAKVLITTREEKAESTLTIDRSFLRYQYGDAYVWVWDDVADKGEKRFVTLGDCDARVCEIDDGLESGEVVVKM